MMVNYKETNEGDKATYIDQEGQIYEGHLTDLAEQDGNCYADLEYLKNDETVIATEVPFNTSPEKNSWNHSLLAQAFCDDGYVMRPRNQEEYDNIKSFIEMCGNN